MRTGPDELHAAWEVAGEAIGVDRTLVSVSFAIPEEVNLLKKLLSGGFQSCLTNPLRPEAFPF